MDKLIENRILYVQIAQLKDELSGVYKELDCTRGELKRSEDSLSLCTERIRQEYEDKLSAMSEHYRIEQEQRESASREEVSRMQEDHRKKLLEKEREI